MTPGLFLLVAVGGGLGAAARLVVDGLVMRRASGRFPWGILVVNTSGSFLLGIVTGLAMSDVLAAPWAAVLGTGVLGGYTTFSTAMLDSIRLVHSRDRRRALANALGMLAITLVAAGIGLLLGRAV